MLGIFTIMCPDCGAPVDQRHPAAVAADRFAGDVTGETADDVIVCTGCGSAFVVRFGHALALPSADAGAA